MDETAWGQYQPKNDTTSVTGIPRQITVPPMPPVKQLRDEACEDCAKSDVCSIQEEFMRAFKDILEIEGMKRRR